jgi:ABC-type nitrate/sulfonate/bicarbonate transport system permease component
VRAHDPEGNLVQRNPAETTTPVAMAVAVLIASWLGADESVIVPLAIVLAFTPTAVKFLVGLRG